MSSSLKPLQPLALDDFVERDEKNRASARTARVGRGVKQGSAQGKIDQHLQALRERQRLRALEEQKIHENRVLQEILPLWDDDNRGVPNPLIRSGLFSVKKSDVREYVDIVVASLSNYRITYRGEELQQDDLSVWLSLINLARERPMSDSIYFSGYSLVKDLDWRMHSDSYLRAEGSIKRLKVTGLTISSPDGNEQYTGSLIREYAFKADDGAGNSRWMVRFEPKVSALFMEDTTTLLEWEVRKKIGARATVALFLHSFYSSHAEPLPISVGKLHELSRSEDTVAGFKRTLLNALRKLEEVGFLSSYHLIGDLISVTKNKRPRLITAKKAGRTPRLKAS